MNRSPSREIYSSPREVATPASEHRRPTRSTRRPPQAKRLASRAARAQSVVDDGRARSDPRGDEQPYDRSRRAAWTTRGVPTSGVELPPGSLARRLGGFDARAARAPRSSPHDPTAPTTLPLLSPAPTGCAEISRPQRRLSLARIETPRSHGIGAMRSRYSKIRRKVAVFVADSSRMAFDARHCEVERPVRITARDTFGIRLRRAQPGLPMSPPGSSNRITTTPARPGSRPGFGLAFVGVAGHTR